ncbi:HisA/HisF-related TIM barrel protein [Thiovibrio sp. JS02]
MALIRPQNLEKTQVSILFSLNCWYQCTVKGGREGRDVDALELAKACEELGAGEILLNCIDKDGTNSGFDLELIRQIKEAVSIPVIASSGAGRVEHFSEVFEKTNADAALAAGIFHRREVPISAVKEHLRTKGVEIR